MGGMTQSLQHFNIKVAVLVGAAANTNIAVAGIEMEDEIVACIDFATAAAISTMTDRTATTTITSSGNIQCSISTATNGLLLFWCDRSL